MPLRIGLPNIVEGSITNIPIQGRGLTMGMEGSDQLGKPNGKRYDYILAARTDLYRGR